MPLGTLKTPFTPLVANTVATPFVLTFRIVLWLPSAV